MPSTTTVHQASASLIGRHAPAALLGTAARLLPGIALCGAVTLAAVLLEELEAGLLGRAWLKALVLAILVGTLVRTVWTPSARLLPGISFSAKTLLEAARRLPQRRHHPGCRTPPAR
jgi:hypothetical protein